MPPRMKVRDILARIEADGWFLVRTRGSHRQYHHPHKSGTVTIAGRPNDVVHPKVLQSILRQAQLEE